MCIRDSHCTVCHKCYNPCPVDIDFGDVSMNMRAVLRRMGRKSFNPGTASAMFFLNAKDPVSYTHLLPPICWWTWKRPAWRGSPRPPGRRN